MDRYKSYGPLALVGSGEYTSAMYETDRLLLSRLGARPRAALLPTASGMEPGGPEHWNSMGADHFTVLGALVSPLDLISSQDARDPEIVAELERADLIYFSGGNPEYLVSTLRDTAAWATILRRYRAGAALAGCSAGAMMLGGYTVRVRQVINGLPPSWMQALGVIPHLAVLPHFDRIAGFAGAEVFERIVASAPADAILVGIDEDTAMVGNHNEPWQVTGRRSVTVFVGDGTRHVYYAGAQFELPTV